jgi:hypothetical protein
MISCTAARGLMQSQVILYGKALRICINAVKNFFRKVLREIRTVHLFIF